MSERPLIGITKPTRGDNLAFWCICAGVWLAGGQPLRLTAEAPRHKRVIDGLVLGGGTDVFPGLYATRPKRSYLYDRKRDEMEIAWARRAKEVKIPVMGICRGAQLMNVINGGTLHLEVKKAFRDVDYPSTLPGHILYRKLVELAPDSHIRRAIGMDCVGVNSMHKQAIDKVGDGLVVTAWERNGVVQAIEDPRRHFYLGVQFHPEFLLHRKHFRRIFQVFIDAVRADPRTAEAPAVP